MYWGRGAFGIQDQVRLSGRYGKIPKTSGFGVKGMSKTLFLQRISCSVGSAFSESKPAPYTQATFKYLAASTESGNTSNTCPIGEL